MWRLYYALLWMSASFEASLSTAWSWHPPLPWIRSSFLVLLSIVLLSTCVDPRRLSCSTWFLEWYGDPLDWNIFGRKCGPGKGDYKQLLPGVCLTKNWVQDRELQLEFWRRCQSKSETSFRKVEETDTTSLCCPRPRGVGSMWSGSLSVQSGSWQPRWYKWT